MTLRGSCATGWPERSVGARSVGGRRVPGAVPLGPFLSALPGRFSLSAGDPQPDDVAAHGGAVGPRVSKVTGTTAWLGALDHPIHPSRAPVPARGIPLVDGALAHRSAIVTTRSRALRLTRWTPRRPSVERASGIHRTATRPDRLVRVVC